MLRLYRVKWFKFTRIAASLLFVTTLASGKVFAVEGTGLPHDDRTPPILPSAGDTPEGLPRMWAPNAPSQGSATSALPHVVTPTGGEATAWRRQNGSFALEAMVNNQPTSMLFDTGASLVTLRAEDAARLGVAVNALTYSIQSKTANGVTWMAPATIATISVGSITVHDIPALIARPGTLQDNLLGQSFLERLREYKVESNHVIFRGI
jgi:clan AA aspartic protease (TIGR02281 family)